MWRLWKECRTTSGFIDLISDWGGRDFPRLGEFFNLTIGLHDLKNLR